VASLYERFAGTEDGARRLAAARLRHETLRALHRALNASGLSQVELAKRLGVRKSAVSQVLNGNGNVRITTLAEYLYATGHEMTVTVVPAGQPRAEVLARRANVAVARHPYATAEETSRHVVVHAAVREHGGL
jgi:transcriptional regulator with XRE-family HTH domain